MAAFNWPVSTLGTSDEVAPSCTMTRTEGWRSPRRFEEPGINHRAVVPITPSRVWPETLA